MLLIQLCNYLYLTFVDNVFAMLLFLHYLVGFHYFPRYFHGLYRLSMVLVDFHAHVLLRFVKSACLCSVNPFSMVVRVNIVVMEYD